MTYQRNAAPAVYDHRGLWCLRCDAQQPHYRAHKSTGLWRCTVCEHVEGEPVPPQQAPQDAAGMRRLREPLAATREQRLQALGFEPVSDEQRSNNRLVNFGSAQPDPTPAAEPREPSWRELMQPLCNARHPLVLRKLDNTASRADLVMLEALNGALDVLQMAELDAKSDGKHPLLGMQHELNEIGNDVESIKARHVLSAPTPPQAAALTAEQVACAVRALNSEAAEATGHMGLRRPWKLAAFAATALVERYAQQHAAAGERLRKELAAYDLPVPCDQCGEELTTRRALCLACESAKDYCAEEAERERDQLRRELEAARADLSDAKRVRDRYCDALHKVVRQTTDTVSAALSSLQPGDQGGENA